MRSLATLIEADGSWTLRFERRFDHPIDKVWRRRHRARAPRPVVPAAHRR